MLPIRGAAQERAGDGPTALDAALESRRGRVVIVNFWASWCAPCKKEMPLLGRVALEYQDRGVDVVAASIDEPADFGDARAFLRKRGLEFPSIYGLTTQDMIARKLGDAVPATVILDREGVARFRLIGEMQEADLRARIEATLAGRFELPEIVVPSGMTVEHFVEDHEKGEAEGHDEHGEEEGGSATPG